jgi:hypothetical protein
VSLKKFDLTGSVTPKNRHKVGVVYDFPAKIENTIKTHISVKSRDIDTKFEPQVAAKKYTLDFGLKVTYRPIQDGGSRHYEKNQTVITQSILIWFQWNLITSVASSNHSQKCNTGSDQPLSRWPPPPCLKFEWML